MTGSNYLIKKSLKDMSVKDLKHYLVAFDPATPFAFCLINRDAYQEKLSAKNEGDV